MLRNCVARLSRAGVWAVMAAVIVSGLSLSASAQVTLPDLGVDVEGTATAMATALGTIVASLIAIYGAFLVVRMGVRWMRGTVK